MIETHPFGNFVPENIRYLILGSFAAKGIGTDPAYDWYYGSKYNQFWKILEQVYSVKLADKNAKIKIFTKLQIGITDIIYQCERSQGSSLDTNLVNIVYNDSLVDILENNNIEKIFFTSRFVETKYRKVFKHLIEKYPDIELITLPSPSPRYARISIQEKVEKYKQLLPDLANLSENTLKYK